MVGLDPLGDRCEGVAVLDHIDLAGDRGRAGDGVASKGPDGEGEEQEQTHDHKAQDHPSVLDPDRWAAAWGVGDDPQPGENCFVLQFEGDRHRSSFSEHLFASFIFQHEQVFGVNNFSERLFALHEQQRTVRV